MPGYLNEALNIPKIGGTLSVSGSYVLSEVKIQVKRNLSNKSFWGKTLLWILGPIKIVSKWKEIFEYSWSITFIVSGPDARYNSASEYFDKDSLPDLIKVLEDTLPRLETLNKEKFDGKYEEIVFSKYSFDLKLIGYENHITLDFWFSSNTYSFYRSMNRNEVIQTINILKTIERRVQRLQKSLQKMEDLKRNETSAPEDEEANRENDKNDEGNSRYKSLDYENNYFDAIPDGDTYFLNNKVYTMTQEGFKREQNGYLYYYSYPKSIELINSGEAIKEDNPLEEREGER